MMKSIYQLIHRFTFIALLVGSASAAPPPPTMTAKDIATKLGSLQQDGSSYVRLTLEVKPLPDSPKMTLQLQIKQRRTATATEMIYQVIWPKARAGEGVLLRQPAGQPASGAYFTPPDTLRPLTASQMKDALFGSDLTFADVLENFFAWQNQTIIGTGVIDRVSCQILESKPDKSQHSNYGSVRTWVDLRRMVPMRIDKFLPSGTLARRITTTRVAADDLERRIPADLTVSGVRADASTELRGSRINHAVSYANGTFTADGLKDPGVPRRTE